MLIVKFVDIMRNIFENNYSRRQCLRLNHIKILEKKNSILNPLKTRQFEHTQL